jgi:hypothetical protein
MHFTLAARGMEEPRNSQELLIESVGPVFCFVFSVKFNSTSYVRTYGGTTSIYRQTDGRTERLIWGGLGNLRFLQVNIYMEDSVRDPQTLILLES